MRDALAEQTREAASAAGLTWRRGWDATGDNGASLIGLFSDARSSRAGARAFTSTGVPARVLFAPERADDDAAYHWGPAVGAALLPGRGAFDPGDSPRSWAVLYRAVSIDLPVQLVPAEANRLADGIRRGLAEVAGLAERSASS
jgi:hypothetical protein